MCFQFFLTFIIFLIPQLNKTALLNIVKEMKQQNQINYRVLNKQELLVQILKKDIEIIDLKKSIQKYGHSDVYRQRLEEQIEENQKAIQAFKYFSEFILAQTNKIKHFKQKNINNASSQQILQDKILIEGNESNNKSQQQSEDQGDCSFKQIVDETFKILDTLQSRINEVMVEFIKMKKNIENNSFFAEIQSLKLQISQKMQQNKAIKYLYKKLEQQHKDLMQRIFNSVSQNILQEMQKMQRSGLIDLNKSLIFRVKQLENDKKKTFKKNMQEKTCEKIKYEQILTTLKSKKSQKNQH